VLRPVLRRAYIQQFKKYAHYLRYVCLSACNNSRPIEHVFIQFNMASSANMCRHVPVLVKWASSGHSALRPSHVLARVTAGISQQSAKPRVGMARDGTTWPDGPDVTGAIREGRGSSDREDGRPVCTSAGLLLCSVSCKVSETVPFQKIWQCHVFVTLVLYLSIG
jgi:hypothetical protein